ncbi:MAG: hydrogenase expression/formation protein HypE [Bacteroidales bacterium]|jgi:hydrogenase expression/formation protein HypE
MDKCITLNHGTGGKLTGELIRDVFAGRFGIAEPLTDSAIIDIQGSSLAFTTDSYVVDPLFFPGGNIGKLAVCGTVNDIAVSGASPDCLSAAFIIEEGFLLDDLIRIVESMAEEAKIAGVRIVTGDTKVVEKGKCDGIFITTSGYGHLRSGCEHISSAVNVREGDSLIITGPVGNHSVAVMGARKKINFSTPVESDVACLNHLIDKVLDRSGEIHFMRDLTRGGLATVLNELCRMTGLTMEINESCVPVEEPVQGICEILGFDPLYLANEGKALIVAGDEDHEKVMAVLRSDPLGRNSSVIGKVLEDKNHLVVMNTSIGGRRILDLHSGTQLPRIC